MSRIGIISDNSISYVEALLTIWNNGDSAVLIDWRIPPKRATQLLGLAGVKKCYIEFNHYKAFAKAENIDWVIMPSACKDTNKLPDSVLNLFNENYNAEEAIVFFSSGTTGFSKGISLSHKAIQLNADAVIDYMKPTIADGIYIAKTLAHSSTLVAELLVGLKSKCEIYLQSTMISPNRTLKNLKETNASILCVNPTLLTIYTMAMKNNYIHLPNLKKIYVSGSILKDSQMAESRKIFNKTRIYNIYGLTEAGPRVCAQTDENYFIKNTVGKPIKGVSVKIVKDNKEAACGDKGIVVVKTESCYTTYINQTIQSASHPNDNSINTGDFGYQDADGNIFIIGRSDDMIIKSSHNIFPDSIENKVLKYPNVDDCIVFGYEDMLYGQIIICFIVSNENNVNADSLKDFCRERLAPYEVPDIFMFVNEIPVTSNGKKSRNIAQKIYEEKKR